MSEATFRDMVKVEGGMHRLPNEAFFRDPKGTASKQRTGNNVGHRVSGRGYVRNDKTPRGSTLGVLR